MIDDVTIASESLSRVPGGSLIQRMGEYLDQNPGATRYSVATEAEAAELLLMIADQLRVLLNTKSERNTYRRSKMREADFAFRRAVYAGTALHYIASLIDEEAIEIYGMQIVVPRVIVNQ